MCVCVCVCVDKLGVGKLCVCVYVCLRIYLCRTDWHMYVTPTPALIEY